jgi:hypothetical protein
MRQVPKYRISIAGRGLRRARWIFLLTLLIVLCVCTLANSRSTGGKARKAKEAFSPPTASVSSLNRSIQAQPAASSQASSGPKADLGWQEVKNTKLQIVCPPRTRTYDFARNCRDVIRGWSGAIADTKRDRLILWGGGHNGYYGNELYAFDLVAQKLTRLNDPSPIANGLDCPAELADGKPNSRHTYNELAYIEYADRMFAFSGAVANKDGCQTRDTWTLDLSTLKWTRMDPVHGDVPMAGHPVAAYDPNSRLVFIHDQWRHLYSYNYDTNTYRVYPRSVPRALHMTAAIDPKRKLFIMFGDLGSPDGGGLRVYDIGRKSNFQEQNWTSRSKGCDVLMKSAFPGLAYDPVLDRIVGWPNLGNTVYIFDPETVTCTSKTFPNGPPDSDHEAPSERPPYSNGTFGRFRYFPDKNIYVLINDWDIDTFLLRLTSN